MNEVVNCKSTKIIINTPSSFNGNLYVQFAKAFTEI